MRNFRSPLIFLFVKGLSEIVTFKLRLSLYLREYLSM